MSNHPDDEKLDESHAAITRATRQRQQSSIIEMTLVAVAAILISVSTAFSAWNTFELRKLQDDQVAERRLILLGTECIIAEFAEHRGLNAAAHRANAAEHDFTYPIPPESEPPAIPGVLEEVCKTFLHTTTTSTVRR